MTWCTEKAALSCYPHGPPGYGSRCHCETSLTVSIYNAHITVLAGDKKIDSPPRKSKNHQICTCTRQQLTIYYLMNLCQILKSNASTVLSLHYKCLHHYQSSMKQLFCRQQSSLMLFRFLMQASRFFGPLRVVLLTLWGGMGDKPTTPTFPLSSSERSSRQGGEGQEE